MGVKALYELFPSDLASRLKAQRAKLFDELARTREAEESRQLQEWNAAHPKPTLAEKREQAELEARVAGISALRKGFSDPGAVVDCVVFHDGRVWRAALDVIGSGDFAQSKLLCDYHLDRVS